MRLGPDPALSGAIGGTLWVVTDDIKALPVAVAAVVLPDADHPLDYCNWWGAGTGGVFSIFLRGWDYLIAVAAVYAAMFTPRWMLALVQLAGVFAHPAGAGEIPEDAYQ